MLAKSKRSPKSNRQLDLERKFFFNKEDIKFNYLIEKAKHSDEVSENRDEVFNNNMRFVADFENRITKRLERSIGNVSQLIQTVQTVKLVQKQ
jgi:hypothetical protein